MQRNYLGKLVGRWIFEDFIEVIRMQGFPFDILKNTKITFFGRLKG
jgi:hypothetical protein